MGYLRSKKRKLIAFLLLCLLVFLSSCAHQPSPYPIHSTDEKQLKLSKIPDSWELSGRISITYEEENWTARFHWVKKSDQFKIDFTGPFGQKYLSLEQQQQQNQTKNTLTIGNDVYHNQGDIEQLLAQYTPTTLPINSLQYWIFGHYNPTYPYQLKVSDADKAKHKNEIDTEIETMVEELRQQQWTISFSRYHQVAWEHKPLSSVKNYSAFYPKKIQAKNILYNIKLIVSHFTLHK